MALVLFFPFFPLRKTNHVVCLCWKQCFNVVANDKIIIETKLPTQIIEASQQLRLLNGLSNFQEPFHCSVISSSPDSMNIDRNDKSGLSSGLYKLIVPLLRCEVVDIRDAAVNALGLINHDALK